MQEPTSSNASDRPADDELEVSVFGPGMGESVVAHIGAGLWIVVDSFLNRQTGRPIALDYFESIGVDAGTQIKLVLATHWHDDHIQGLSAVVAAAVRATFATSAAHSLADISRLVSLGSLGLRHTSATREFDQILTLLERRRLKGDKRNAVGPIPAVANRRLVRVEGAVLSEVHSISPADAVFNIAANELRDALRSIEVRRRPRPPGPNQLSVALWVKMGFLDVLLGADLEHASGTNQGWNAVVASQERPQGKAQFVKVPHHGSKNAHSDDCWSALVEPSAVAALTPYSPSRLPSASDLRRLCKVASDVYLTADPSGYGFPRRDNAVEKTMREMAIARRVLTSTAGHIRIRCNASTLGAKPVVRLSDGAKRIAA